MEFGEMKRNTSNWSNVCMLLRRAGFTASAGLSCLTPRSMTLDDLELLWSNFIGISRDFAILEGNNG